MSRVPGARRAAPPPISRGALIAGAIAAFISCAGLGVGLIGYLTGRFGLAAAASVGLVGAIGTVVVLCLALDAKTRPDSLVLRIAAGLAIAGGGAALAIFLLYSPFDFIVPVALGLSIIAQLLIVAASFTHYR